MKKFTSKVKYIFTLLLMSTVTLQFSSCIDDDWFEDGWYVDGWYEDDWRDHPITNRWYVDGIVMDYGECPYASGDQFTFYPNGRLEVRGHDDFAESGRWRIANNRMSIDWDGDNREDMVGYIIKMQRHFLSIDFKDYYDGYESRYTLHFLDR